MHKGWKVALAGLFINILTGFPYAWSIFATALSREPGWDYTHASLPYTVFLFSYAFSMALAGRLQDRHHPRLMVAAGGVLMGGATIVSSFLLFPWSITLTWGVVWGMGLACSYATVTPAAIKWFPSGQKGRVTGVVVFGMGLSALIMAPFCHFLIQNFGLQYTFLIIGLLLLVGVISLSVVIENPPREKPAGEEKGLPRGSRALPLAIFRYPQFYMLWLMFCIFAGTGVTFVSHMDTISRTQASFELGFIMVSLFSLFNAIGRIISGYISDRLGRRQTITLVFLALALTLGAALLARTPAPLGIVVSVVGLAYGGMFTLFPAIMASYFGEENLGFNYGLVFSSMMAGSLFPLAAGYLYETRGDFLLALGILLLLNLGAALLSFLLKKPEN